MRRGRLESEIVSLIGNHPGMVEEFKSVVLQLHREHSHTIAHRNSAIGDIMAQFGIDRMQYAKLVGVLRRGTDPGTIRKFDELSEYAKQHYPEVLGFSRSESETGSCEEQLAKLLIEGIKPIPKAWDAQILELAIDFVGGAFFESFCESCSESPVKQAAAQRRALACQCAENNTTMSRVFRTFGFEAAKFGAIVRSLRAGSCGQSVPNFDNMARYACENYPHLVAPCRAACDSDREAFIKWVIRGYIYAPSRSSPEGSHSSKRGRRLFESTTPF